MTEGDGLARAAATFIGVPFRLYGRDPDNGLDCVGLLLASLTAVGRNATPPTGYRLRTVAIDQWLHLAGNAGLASAQGQLLSGDVVLTSPGPNQHHIMIAENCGSFIHAHAGLRRVVRQPFPALSNMRAHWRIAP
ncbi:MAG: NlpC/P60 family protein [Erythrobacter sp.]